MNPLNKKIAIGVAGASATALAGGAVANVISDNKLNKERKETLENIAGNSKEARKLRRQVNKDYNKEEKSIDHTIELATAGAIAASGLIGTGIHIFAK
jgi:acetyl-CoA carboxylase carboxyltransferase component